MTTARRFSDGFNVEFNFDEAEEFTDAIELLTDRLIAEIPSVLRDIDAALWATETPHLSAVPSHGVSKIKDDESNKGTASPRPDPGPHPVEGDLIAFLVDLPDDPAEAARAKRFLAYEQTQAERRRVAFTAWLEKEASAFARRRQQWFADFRIQLRREFNADDSEGS
jgi:hypothetical protein